MGLLKDVDPKDDVASVAKVKEAVCSLYAGKPYWYLPQRSRQLSS
jgi:hypothetical protein